LRVNPLPENVQEMAVVCLPFTCPNTSLTASTGVEMDVPGLRANWKRTLRLDCPHCGDVHDVCVRELFISNAVDGLDSIGIERALTHHPGGRKPSAAASTIGALAHSPLSRS
jgi:hypothetical protein